jgi:exopolyphosphatase / guanosine-5'-triphosphate,3'-diphosphate pyrophosphatase
MKLGVIDLGSNTIRLVIYNWNGKKLEKLENVKRKAQSIKYVHQGIMDQDGFNVIIESLKELLMIARIHDTRRINIFATASLRNIKNTQEAKQTIESAIHHPIEILDGVDESLFGFEGMKRTIELPLLGVSVDIGGGSTEITYFKNKQAIQAVSLPIGSLNLYMNQVGDVLPTDDEQTAIRKTIQSHLASVPWLSQVKVDQVIGIGGSARAIVRIHQARYELNQSIFDLTLSQNLVHRIAAMFGDDQFQLSRLILEAVPDRLTTVIPGALILDELMMAVHAQELRVSSAGLREGYLYTRMLEEISHDPAHR